MPSHIIMLSPKLKWPRETSCIPNSTLQPISDQRTRSALDNQVTHLFLILNTQSTITELDQRTCNFIDRSLASFSFRTKTLLFFCIQLLRIWSVLDILTLNKRNLEEKYIIFGIHHCTRHVSYRYL